MIFPQNGVAMATRSVLETLSNLAWPCEINSWQRMKLHVLELDQTNDCTPLVSSGPCICSAMIVCFARFEEGLREPPTALLTSLDGDIQYSFGLDDD